MPAERIIHRDVAPWNLLQTDAMEVRQAAQVADDALAGDPASASLWRCGRFTEATGRSLISLGQHRDSLDQALQLGA